MIKLTDIKKHYGKHTVLDIKELTFKKGETTAIIGPNGSGKSTLLRIIAEIIKSDSGYIKKEGRVYYLPQQNVPFKMSVKDNILFSAEDKEDKDKKCNRILNSLSLADLQDKSAKSLSGGECQRLCLGRVLVNKGDFLLLDEPSSSADIESTEIIEKAIKEYKTETGCGIILTTHSPSEALRLADRIIMLNNGIVVEDGKPGELIDTPKTDWGKKFIEMWKI